jgi:hypothetical protein
VEFFSGGFGVTRKVLLRIAEAKKQEAFEQNKGYRLLVDMAEASLRRGKLSDAQNGIDSAKKFLDDPR